MIERIDVGELPLYEVFLDTASIELWTTRIYDYSPSSVSSLYSIAQKRISDSTPRVLSPGGGFPKGLDGEALTEIF